MHTVLLPHWLSFGSIVLHTPCVAWRISPEGLTWGVRHIKATFHREPLRGSQHSPAQHVRVAVPSGGIEEGEHAGILLLGQPAHVAQTLPPGEGTSQVGPGHVGAEPAYQGPACVRRPAPRPVEEGVGRHGRPGPTRGPDGLYGRHSRPVGEGVRPVVLDGRP